jgi:hypothetical protein
VQRAVLDLSSTIMPRRHPFTLDDRPLSVGEEAFVWLFMNHEQTPFSLAWCCEVLDVTVQHVREVAEAHNPADCWLMAKTLAGIK